MRARAHFSRSSRRWRWSLVCRANWRLSNVAAPYNARLRRRLRVRARRLHAAEVRVEHRAGGRAPAAHGRHDASSATGHRAAGTAGRAAVVSATDHRDLRDRPHSGHRHRAVAQSERHQLARGGVGSGAAAGVRHLRAPGAARPEVVSHPGRRDHQDAEFLVRRIRVRVRRDREAAFESRSDFRLSGPPGDHLRLGAVRDPLLPGRDAARGQGIRGTDEQGDGSEWRRESQRCRLDLHGSDRGAAHDPPVSPGNDPLRADDGHDRGDGACVGVDHGRLYRHGHRSAASAHRGDHDGARYHHDAEDHRAGNRDAADLGGVRVEIPRTDVNIVDAAARGTTDGLHLMLNVIAILVSFVALVALLNGAFGWVHGYVTWFPESIQTVLGWVFRPIAFAMGVPWHDSGTIGGLLGTRMVLNEFLAYAQLGPMRAQLDPVSFTIATFALCGFANISSVGIQIGGIGALVPDRKHDLARLGFRAMIAGTLANFLSATLAGILL